MQIQMAMGLAHATFCDFIVYTFRGMFIIRTLFDENYFHEVVTKLNVFYKEYLLPSLPKPNLDDDAATNSYNKTTNI